MSAVPALLESMDALLRPSASFDCLPASERRRLASTFLDLFHGLQVAYLARKARSGDSVRQLIAAAAVGEDIAQGLAVWRYQLHRARFDERSPQGPERTRRGHQRRQLAGRPEPKPNARTLLDSSPANRLLPGAKTTLTAAAVPSSVEDRP